MTRETRIEYFTDVPIGHLTDPRGYPAQEIIGRLIQDPGKGPEVAAEIARIRRGEATPVAVDLDAFAACVVVRFLKRGLQATAADDASRVIAEKLVRSLETQVALSCPALAGVLAKASALKGGQS